MACRSLAWLVFPFIAACGTTPDERPQTFEVVALSILAPSCGQVQCHSATTNLEHYAFDTLDGAHDALGMLVTPGDPAMSDLVFYLTTDGDKRMPADAPMDDQDIDLIRAWITKGAPGL